MKKLMLAGLFLLLGTFVASAQELPTIRIVNNTGYTICYLFVSSSESDDWGEDLLGEDVLEDGKTFTYKLSQPLNQFYDIVAEDEDGDTYYKWNVTITNNARIVFTLEDLE